MPKNFWHPHSYPYKPPKTAYFKQFLNFFLFYSPIFIDIPEKLKNFVRIQSVNFTKAEYMLLIAGEVDYNILSCLIINLHTYGYGKLWYDIEVNSYEN